MENASKAVIMAGGVLIAVAVISLALYAYGVFSGYAESSEQMLTATQIQSFNRFYESYVTEGGTTSTIRGVDVINIISKAKDDGIESVPNISTRFPELIGDEQAKAYLDSYSYSIGYDSQGKVNKITIN